MRLRILRVLGVMQHLILFSSLPTVSSLGWCRLSQWIQFSGAFLQWQECVNPTNSSIEEIVIQNYFKIFSREGFRTSFGLY